MENRKLRTAVGALPAMVMILLAGCGSAPQSAPVASDPAVDVTPAADEGRNVADTAMGRESEILARGDLAQDGREQLLVVDRLSKGLAGTGTGNPSPILIVRAAIFEKNDGKWAEILRCDEHLKNPRGYLGGSPVERVNGWQLEYGQDAKKGLEMKFTPADARVSEQKSGAREGVGQPVMVRWNQAAKRYQSLDRSHSKYLAELPALEAQPSFLK